MSRPARSIRILSVATLATASLAGAVSVTTPADAAPGTGAKPAAHQSVIVVLRDQVPGQPANAAHLDTRRAVTRSSQSAVLGRLSGAAPAKLIHFTVGNAFSATVTSAQAADLARDPAVASVVPNRKIPVVPQPGATASSTGTRAKAQAAAAPPAVDPRACSTDRSKPVLEPEALQTMRVRSQSSSARTAAKLGINGKGVKVAYIADGINPRNKGFRRADGSSSVIDYKDFYGDGPNAPTSGAEAFGDASAVSAQGNVVYDVANYANPSSVSFPGGHCYIKIVGVAPGADVVALKAGSELLPNSAILQSIDYAVSKAHVDVINESFGGNLYPDSGSRNTVQLFNDQAVKAGVSVTASTGDAGITSTIGSPSTDPKVISTGASTDSRLYEQTNYALATKFGNGRWLDSNTSALSSAGITQNGRTIDLSAPGEADWAVCDAGGNFSGCTSFGNPDHPLSNVQAFGGTSQSAPFTAGVAALVIQAYRKNHAGSSPSPAVVKRIITSTTRDSGLPGEEQGAGLVDARAAVEAALTWPGARKDARRSVASNVALSRSQLTLTGQPGTTRTGSFTVRNVGNKRQTIVASTRRYAELSRESANVTLSTSSAQTTPYPTTGAPWVYRPVTFTVPSGADELASTIRWQSGATDGGAGPVVRLSLFAPDGTYAGNTRPQGGPSPANYGLITIKRPTPGTWTGVLYTPATGGYSGTVATTNQTYRAIPGGGVSPSRTSIAPGQSAKVTVSMPIPSVGGDGTQTVSVGSSDGHQTAVPVVLRALVPTTSGPGRFAGTITGGNARSYSPAQTFSYAFDVPSDKKDLDVAVTLADDPADLLQGVLVDPHGEVQSVNTNQSVSSAGDTTQGRSMQNTVAAPEAGRWRYVVVVQSPVSGRELTEDFAGTVAFDAITATDPAFPTTLPAGKPTTRTISVKNTGPAPMLVQTDARTGTARPTQLSPQFAGSTLKLPQDVEDLSQLPAYLVPPDTKSVSVTASTTSPAHVELSSPAGGIDVFGNLQAAQRGSTVSTATVSEAVGQVGLGYWFPYVQQIGPFGNNGAPSATSVLSAVATLKPFDDTVTTSTGDPFVATTDPTEDPGAPLVIAPGKTRSIKVTITPTASSGSTVSGTLHLVTTPIGTNSFNTTGEVLDNIPYQYTVQ